MQLICAFCISQVSNDLAHILTKTLNLLIFHQVDSLPKDDGTLLKKREELQKEVEQTKRALATQVKASTALLNLGGPHVFMVSSTVHEI